MALPFEEHVETRLLHELSSPDDVSRGARRHIDLGRRIASVVTAMLDGELLPPTERQLKYGLAIARELAIELPADALQYREAMGLFISTHADRYRRRKGTASGRPG
ncbi:hypothetical protein [Solimonas marina]|uniref:Uncharacterized protein n=1 Tax=Solimonas marina TaxID=2714601 RepID=A0A969WD59_9GAMM|nr:hypothetical protein [Solimonas marina]NKF24388.1 hypothetical protein [Solimonas marina]